MAIKTLAGPTVYPLATDSGASLNDVLESVLLTALPTKALATTTYVGAGTIARSLASRGGERYNVLDYGADRAGVLDSSPALSAIAALTGPVGKGTVFFPTGTYLFNGYTYFDTGVVLEVDSGTRFTGTGNVIADCDGSVLANGRAGMAHLNVSSTDANYHAQYISHVVAGSTGTLDYEKSGLYVGISTYDASAYTHGTSLDTVAPNKDVVAIQATANILPGNMIGRAAAITTISACTSGSDGSLGGIEVDMVNFGVAQGENNRFNTKTAYNAVANGPNQVTTAYQVTNAGGSFFDGYSVLKNSVTRYAFVLRDLSAYPSTTSFSVDVSGNVVAPTLQLTAYTSSSIGGSALLAGASTSTTVAIAGLTTGMVIMATPTTYPGDSFYWRAYCSSAGIATIKLVAAIAGTPTASTYNLRVVQ